MKLTITALRNFIANGVHGAPGYVLTQEQNKTIENLLNEMKDEGLISVEIQPETDSPDSESKPKRKKK